jgi:hypothetical protein
MPNRPRPRPVRLSQLAFSSKPASLVAFSNPPDLALWSEFAKSTSMEGLSQADDHFKMCREPTISQDFTFMNDAEYPDHSSFIHHSCSRYFHRHSAAALSMGRPNKTA